VALGALAFGGCAESALAPREAIDTLIITTTTSTIVTGGGIQLGLMVFGVSGQLVRDEPSTWSSDNPNVATVSGSGFVQGVRPGVATIRAMAGGKVTDIVMLVLLAGCSGADGDSVSIGGSVSGALTVRPCFLSGGYTAYGHVLRVEQAGTIQVDLRGSGFYPTLMLTTATGAGRRTAQSADGQTASLRATVAAGTYILWAATLGNVLPQNGYSISVANAAGACPASPVGSLEIGAARSVTLSNASCQLLGGPVVEGWRMRVDVPTRVRLVGASADFPPMVALTDEELNLISVADAAGPGRAALSWLLLPGDYRVFAGSFYSGAGDLDVSLEEIEICTAAPALALGSPVQGTLAGGDCQYDPWADRYADAYLLTLDAPTRVQFDLTSGSFDAILFVTRLDGSLVGQDDDSGDGLNSRLVVDLPSGTYRVWASSYQRGLTGAYTLSAVAAPAAAPSAAPLAEVGRKP
jgi:hypothetical protein